MSIASEKVKPASERFLLVRFRPGRYIEPSLTTGSDYAMSFSYPIAKITRNDTELTLVSSLSGNDQYTYNETTGALVVRLASAPNSTTNVLIAHYYLFYTGTVYRSIYETPTDITSTARDWKPLIRDYPVFAQSIDNIIMGVFTISNSSITLINSDGDFQQYLSANDSFYNKEVHIWLCIDSVSNIQKVFTGTVTSLSLSQNTVTLQINDGFKQLQKPAFMGDTEDECMFRRNASSFPDLDPNKNETPCPYIVGSSSRYKTIFNNESIATAPGYKYLDEANEAACVDYTEVVSVTTNRNWGACRVKNSVATQSISGGVRTNDLGDYVLLQYTTLSNVVVGDTFTWTNAGLKYGLVVHVGSFTYGGSAYNLIVKTSQALTHTDTITANKSFGVVIVQDVNDKAFPLYGRDYTITETATSGSNAYVKIVFANNFEASLSLLLTLDPNKGERVLYRCSNSDIQTHATILKDMVEAAGLFTNASTFTQADIDLVVNARFQIPNFDEKTYKNYLEYCQDVLKSTLGFFRLNEGYQVEYYLLEAPIAGDTRDRDLMLSEQSSIQIEYQDIITKIIAYNPHRENQEAIDEASSPSETAESMKSQYLNGIVNVDRFRHCLEEISSKITDHINLKCMRSAKYRISTATQDIDTDLGDDLSLDNKIVLGSSDQKNVKVIGIEKAPTRITIEALDLEGL